MTSCKINQTILTIQTNVLIFLYIFEELRNEKSNIIDNLSFQNSIKIMYSVQWVRSSLGKLFQTKISLVNISIYLSSLERVMFSPNKNQGLNADFQGMQAFQGHLEDWQNTFFLLLFHLLYKTKLSKYKGKINYFFQLVFLSC